MMRELFAGPGNPRASVDHAGPPLVLVALEPRVYADAIGGVIADLRPGLETLVVDPDDLPTGEPPWARVLVLCSRPRPEGLHAAVRWVQYAPYEDPDVVRVDGRAERIPGLPFEDLLGLVDRFCGAAAPAAARVAV